MDEHLVTGSAAEQTYHSIRNSIVSARQKLSSAVNSALVTAYNDYKAFRRAALLLSKTA